MASVATDVKAVTPVVSNTVSPAKADETVTVVINKASADMLGVAFTLQRSFENESKFQRSFLYDACKGQLLYMARAAMQKWDGVVNKATKRFPTLTREQVVKQLRESGNKEIAELYELSVTASAVIAQFKV